MTVFGVWHEGGDWACDFLHLAGQFSLVCKLTWWLGVPGASRKNKLPCSSTFQAFASITFANVPLDKASGKAGPHSRGGETEHLLIEGTAKSHYIWTGNLG